MEHRSMLGAAKSIFCFKFPHKNHSSLLDSRQHCSVAECLQCEIVQDLTSLIKFDVRFIDVNLMLFTSLLAGEKALHLDLQSKNQPTCASSTHLETFWN